MYEFGRYNLEMDAWVNHEMDAFKSTLIKVENFNQSEMRIQADSTKLSCLLSALWWLKEVYSSFL